MPCIADLTTAGIILPVYLRWTRPSRTLFHADRAGQAWVICATYCHLTTHRPFCLACLPPLPLPVPTGMKTRRARLAVSGGGQCAAGNRVHSHLHTHSPPIPSLPSSLPPQPASDLAHSCNTHGPPSPSSLGLLAGCGPIASTRLLGREVGDWRLPSQTFCLSCKQI